MTTIPIPQSFVDDMATGITMTMPVEDGTEYYDVIVEHLGGLEYRCTAKTNLGDRSIDYPKYKDKPEDQTIENWIANMQKYEIMAGFKIYYDIWNFEDNDELYKKLFETFENEQKGRKLLSRPVTGSLRYRSDNDTTEVFMDGKWMIMSAASAQSL
jgi:hypothetical protein